MEVIINTFITINPYIILFKKEKKQQKKSIYAIGVKGHKFEYSEETLRISVTINDITYNNTYSI